MLIGLFKSEVLLTFSNPAISAWVNKTSPILPATEVTALSATLLETLTVFIGLFKFTILTVIESDISL